jgi:GMP synthase (glutamine-hydrolysing)
MKKQIWIVDFGSQYTQLITRILREMGHSSEVITLDTFVERQKEKSLPEALVLSGGPDSIFTDPFDYSFIKDLNIPLLGICYGMQLLAKYFGGMVEKGVIGEYGRDEVSLEGGRIPLDIPKKFSVWMSHSDHVVKMPNDFELLFKSSNGLNAGMIHKSRPIMGLQFHPEVHHSEYGDQVLKFFLNQVAKLKADWNQQSMLSEAADYLKSSGARNILCAFSGGVDSLVAAYLTATSLKEAALHCFFVDHGLLRPQDHHHINTLKKETSLKIEVIDAKNEFLSKLEGVSDPERKRKIIGNTFIEVFEQKVHEYEQSHQIKFDHLLQGTLYPDVIESISPHKVGGKSVTIKSHHNVGGLPERMKLKLLEPLRTFFKDEVRQVGRELGLKNEWIMRHPFPGPGIGVRVMGELTADRIRMVGESDQILFEELKKHDLYHKTWQAFTVLLPIKTVGVKGDGRVYEEVIALRLVDSRDGMTANVTELSFSFLTKVASRVTNEVKGITRVVYDITSKPPGTIEWE